MACWWQEGARTAAGDRCCPPHVAGIRAVSCHTAGQGHASCSASGQLLTAPLCRHRDPKKRATAAEILQHEWVRADGVASDTALQPEVLKRLRGFAAMNKLKKEALKVGGHTR